MSKLISFFLLVFFLFSLSSGTKDKSQAKSSLSSSGSDLQNLICEDFKLPEGDVGPDLSLSILPETPLFESSFSIVREDRSDLIESDLTLFHVKTPAYSSTDSPPPARV